MPTITQRRLRQPQLAFHPMTQRTFVRAAAREIYGARARIIIRNLAKKLLYTFAQRGLIIRLTIPNNQNLPSGRLERNGVLFVTSFISREFRNPISFVCLRNATIEAPCAVVAVPKTTMDKYNFLLRPEYQIGLPGKVTGVKPKTIPEPVN
jgi:hypothetical protein